MMHSILTTVQVVAVVGIVSSSLYYFLCLWSAFRFFARAKRRARSSRRALPPISILKPLKGIDPEIYESFRSHCLQDYPEYEIIFGVSDADDPAIESVKTVAAGVSRSADSNDSECENPGRECEGQQSWRR